jgi:hypothetical protein
MVYVCRLKERQNVIEVFRVTHPHGFLVLEAPEPKCWCGQVIAQKYTLLCAIIVSGIGDVRMLPWQMTCHIGAKNMPVTFKIMTEGVRPQFVRAFPTRYDRWRRASGHKCDKTGGAYSHAAETRVPCPYKCEWHLQLEH